MQIEPSINAERISITAFVYGIYCALLPLNMILNFTGFTINKYVGIVASGLFAIDIVRRHIFKINREYTTIILFFLWSLISIAWTIDDSATNNAISTLFNLVMLTVLGLMRGFNRKEITLVKYSMIVSSAVIYFYLAPNLNVSYTRLTLQSSAGAADQNSLAANMVFPLLMSIDEIKNRENKILKSVNVLCTILISLNLLSIASRGGILSAAISVVVYFYLEGKKRGRATTGKVLIGRIIGVLAVVGLANWILRNVNLPALARLRFSAISSDRGMGRLDIWAGVWKAIWDTPLRHLFGYGYGTEVAICRQFVGQTIGAHNVYLEHWATIGTIGFAILLLMFWQPFKNSLVRKDTLAASCMVALFVVCLPLGFLHNKGAWNIILLSFIGLQTFSDTRQIE